MMMSESFLIVGERIDSGFYCETQRGGM